MAQVAGLTEALDFLMALAKVAPEHRDRMQRWEHGDFDATDNTPALAGTDRTILIGQLDAVATGLHELRHSPHLWPVAATSAPEPPDSGGTLSGPFETADEVGASIDAIRRRRAEPPDGDGAALETYLADRPDIPNRDSILFLASQDTALAVEAARRSLRAIHEAEPRDAGIDAALLAQAIYNVWKTGAMGKTGLAVARLGHADIAEPIAAEYARLRLGSPPRKAASR